MRILIYNDISCHIGGAESFAYQLMEACKERGHTLKFFSFHSKPVSRKKLHNKAWYVACNQLAHTHLIRRFSAELSDFQPDLIHCHNNYYYTASICKVIADSGIPAISTIHDYDLIAPFLSSKGSPLQKLKQRQFGHIMKVSQKITSPTHQLIGRLSHLSKEKFVYLPLFVDFDKWPFNPESFQNPTQIAFLGRIIEDKGVFILLEAFRLLQQKYKQARLCFVGGGSDLLKLKEKARSSGLESFTCFTDYAPHERVITILRSSRFLVLSSIYQELFGLVGIEAQALGLPVIAADVGGVSEWCIQGETGYLYEAQNHQDLFQKMEFLLEHPEVGKNLAQQAYQQIKEKYTKELSINYLLSHYQSLLKTAS
ncbi:MAG: glycosyltransferase family 4 protein [Bacteroidota bacterium]